MAIRAPGGDKKDCVICWSRLWHAWRYDILWQLSTRVERYRDLLSRNCLPVPLRQDLVRPDCGIVVYLASRANKGKVWSNKVYTAADTIKVWKVSDCKCWVWQWELTKPISEIWRVGKFCMTHDEEYARHALMPGSCRQWDSVARISDEIDATDCLIGDCLLRQLIM